MGLLFTLVGVAAMQETLAAPSQVNFDFDDMADLGNPLIGFAHYYSFKEISPSVPCRLENFYLSMRSLMHGWSTFSFDELEHSLTEIASRNRTAIFRVYLVYPGKTQTPTDAVPDFLINEGLNFTSFSGGVSPNWEDSNLIRAMIQLIEALGNRFDADPRIANINAGFLGHWGEWHGDSEVQFASTDTQKQVLEAFQRSFKVTQISARYPDVFGGLNANDTRFGYHDDSFAQDTTISASYGFMNRMELVGATNQWKVGAIGGEFRPELQKCFFDDDDWTKVCGGYIGKSCSDCPDGSFQDDVAVTHSSWQWNNQLNNYHSLAVARARKAVSTMGYKFYLKQLILTQNGSTFQVETQVENRGVAPFYYPVQFQVEVGGVAATLGSLDVLLPGDEVHMSAQLEPHASGNAAFFSLRSAWAPTGVRFAIAEQQSEQNGIIGVSVTLPDAPSDTFAKMV